MLNLDTPLTSDELDFLDRADKLAERLLSGDLNESNVSELSDEDREAFEFICFAAFVAMMTA